MKLRQLAAITAAIAAIPPELLTAGDSLPRYRCYCGGYYCPGDCSPEDFYGFEPLNVRPLRLGPGLVCVSSEEVAELGIPLRSLRGWAGLEGHWQYVDRRCLKRYRRKDGRRAR